METVKKYKVSNSNRLGIHIQWSDELESLMNKVDEHLVNACQHFREKEVDIGSSEELFYADSASLAIFYMLLEVKDSFVRYKNYCYLVDVDLKYIRSFATQFEILVSAIVEYYRELSSLNINPEYILDDLRKAISELEVFIHEFNLSA